MQNESRAVFPNGIRALIVENDARFLRSASLMFSQMNYRVATCDTPASAVRLLNGRLRHAEVVFIDALRAATCDFDFRGIVEPHLCIPVIYLLSRDYGVTGHIAEALQRTVSTATYVIMKPLAADDICGLWGVIQQATFMLRRGENTAWSSEWSRGNRALLPATVQALLPSSSTVGQDQGEEDDVREHFSMVRPRRGRPRRNLGDRHDGGSSGRGRGRGRIAVGSQPIQSLEQMNGTQGQESYDDDDDVIPNYQQPAQQNLRGVQAMGGQNRALFMQPVVPQMVNMPCNRTMISADAAGPSSSNVAAFDGASNTAAPALLPLPVFQALARATSPAPHAVYSAQAPALGLPPPVYQQQQPPMAPARAGRGQRRKLLDDGHDGGSSHRGRGRGRVAAFPFTIRGQPTGRQEQMNMVQWQESDDDDVVPWHQQQQPVPWMLNLPSNPNMISADAAGPSSSNAAAFADARNISSPALLPAYSAQVPAPGLPPVHRQQQPVALYHFSDMAAPPAVAVPTIATTSGYQPPQFTFDQQHDIFAPWRQGGWMEHRCETEPIILSFKQPPANIGASPANDTDAAMAHLQSSQSMAPPASNELAAMVSGNRDNNSGVTDADGGNNASFMVPQDIAVPTRNQVELGAPSIYGSVGSPGPSAIFDGKSDMAAMDQYEENDVFSMDALWDFGDDIPMHPEGQGQQQVAAGIISDGGASGSLGPNWNIGGAADDGGLDIIEELLRKDKADDFQLPQDMNNGQQ